MKYGRTIEVGSTHHTCKSRCNRQRAGRVELLPADYAVYDGSGPCRWFDFPFGSKAVSIGRLDSVYRLRLLPGVASEKMPASAKRDRFCSVVGVRSFCGHLNLLSSSHGVR